MTRSLITPAPATAGPAPVVPASDTTAAPTGSSRTGSLSSIGLLTVLLGAFLSMADFFIVNVALPTIGTDLGASDGMLELVVASYGVTYAVLLVLGGRLGDAFGRRRLFLTGISLFTVTSTLCGFAPTIELLVAARALQGAAAALMVPQVLATIQATTAGAGRIRAIGLYGATGGAAAVVGQLAGGALVAADLFGTGWRLIFLVNVPIGIVGLALAMRHLPPTRSTAPADADVPGTLLLGATLLAVLVPLTEGRTLGWPLWCWLVLGAAPVGAAAFYAVERWAERAGGVPLVPPSLLRLPSVRRGLSIGAPFFAGFGGFMFVYAVALQEGLHLSALSTGLALVPMGLAFLVSSTLSGHLVQRFGRGTLVLGAIVQAAGLLALGATLLLSWPHLGPLSLAPAVLVAGAGQGMIMAPLFRIVLADVPPERAGVASGVLVTMQQSALALGVATIGSLFVSQAAPAALGARNAFLLALAVQTAIALLFAWLARRLPDPRTSGPGNPAR